MIEERTQLRCYASLFGPVEAVQKGFEPSGPQPFLSRPLCGGIA